MKKLGFGFIVAAFVLGAGVLGCDTDLSEVLNGPPVDNTGQTVTVTLNLGGTAYTLTVPKGTVIDDAYINAHKGELEGLSLPFAVSGLALGLDGQAVTANGDTAVPSVWKYNGVAVTTWHTVTFTVNGATYAVNVPEGASLVSNDQTVLETFLGVPAGSLANVTWSALSNITENKTPEEITVTTYTVTFDLDYESADKITTRSVVSGGSIAILPVPSAREGYNFGDWWTGQNGGTTPQTVPKNTQTYTAEGLNNGTLYTFTVKAVNTAGDKNEGATAQAKPVDAALVGTSRYQAALDEDSEYVTFNNEQWTGDATGDETWHLSVLDRREVFFGVKKTAGQTVTANAVSLPAESGMLLSHGAITEITETVDGLVPSDTLAVFKVDANKVHNDKRSNVATDTDAKYDTQFEGDDFQFSLNVSGDTVTVNLRADVTLDNALFIVDKNTGELTRVDVPKSYKNITYHSNQVKPITWDDTPGTRFIDMLVWFDTHYGAFLEGTGDTDIGGTANAYQMGAEYLIRATADEAIPWVYVTMPLEDTSTKLRLRGTGTGTVISAASGKYSNTQYYNCTLHGRAGGDTMNLNVPSVGDAGRGIINLRRGILQLEKNITIQGDATYDGANRHRYLIQIKLPGTLIIKDGAIITGHTATQASSDEIVINLTGGAVTFSDVPCFKMEGGAIRDNTLCGSVIHSESITAGIIQKTGGLITGNTGVNTETPANIVLFGNNLTVEANVYTIAGDTTTVYSLPTQ